MDSVHSSRDTTGIELGLETLKLEHLSYNIGFYHIDAIHCADMVPFFARTCQQLESLSLRDTYIREEELSILPSSSCDVPPAFPPRHLSDALFDALATVHRRVGSGAKLFWCRLEYVFSATSRSSFGPFLPRKWPD